MSNKVRRLLNRSSKPPENAIFTDIEGVDDESVDV